MTEPEYIKIEDIPRQTRLSKYPWAQWARDIPPGTAVLIGTGRTLAMGFGAKARPRGLRVISRTIDGVRHVWIAKPEKPS